MSKGLEELKKLRVGTIEQMFHKSFEIIEQALKTLQEHEEILKSYGLNLCDFREACILLAQWRNSDLSYSKIHKEHKALEIIKNNIKFEEIKAVPFNNYTEYYVVVNGKEIVFNQKEYDLLKEVLL